MAEEVEREFGSIDCLINNAALYYDQDIMDQSIDYLRKVLEINLVEHSPHFGSVQLFIHAVELPLGILSPLCLKCSPLLAAVKPNLLSLTLGSLVYGLCYICLMATMYIWYDAAIYPFIVDMHAVKPFPLGWLGFWAAISLLIAVCVNGLACLVYV